jgi:hypothetical protein
MKKLNKIARISIIDFLMDEVKRRTHDNYENLYKRMAASLTKGD